MGYDDVRSMLRYARVGDSVAAWQAATRRDSRLLAGSRRETQMRIATAVLRPVGSTIVDADFLNDLTTADETTARDLVYGRYLASAAIAVAVAQRFFRIGILGTPPEPITRGSLESLLGELLPTCTEGTRSRTRTAIGTQFSAAGIVRLERDGNLILTRRRPASVAVLHLIRDELDTRREASDSWLASNSLAAAIFAIDPATFSDILENLIASGRLQRSYYAGEPRVLAA
jgi:hypothetical protein